jgi:hypothetical protein
VVHHVCNHTAKHKLVLIRHGESTWNKENRFTGIYELDDDLKPIKHDYYFGEPKLSASRNPDDHS